MAFFSWNCRGCGHPLLSEHATTKINEWMRDVVVIEFGYDRPRFKLGRLLKGRYDGCGGVEQFNVNGVPKVTIKIVAPYHSAGGQPSCWHNACWENAGQPTEHTPSTNAVDQGFFFGPEHDVSEPNFN